MRYAYAKWTIKGTELPDFNELHISNGVGNDQHDAFDLNCQESILTVTGAIDGYDITLKVWSDGLENQEGYWLSPCELDGVEAHDFGITDEEKPARVITTEIEAHIVEVCNYLADEESHYEQHMEEGGAMENHIWFNRQALASFIA